jgi:hypothetical protein
MALDSEVVRTTIAEIERAFAGLRPPGDERLLHPQCMDDGDIVDFYHAPDWRHLNDDAIVSNYAAPSFFSAEAFQYYMPAFMIWSLNHDDTIEYAAESTLRAFDPTAGDAELQAFQVSKYALFTDPQRKAVIRFLQAFSAHPDLGEIAMDALTNYWLNQESDSS